MLLLKSNYLIIVNGYKICWINKGGVEEIENYVKKTAFKN